MTKQERRLTKKLLKEIERLAAHMRESKYDLPIKEAQLALLDENGEGIGLFITVGVDEETGEILVDRTLEEIYNEEDEEMEIVVELEEHEHDDFEEEWDSSFSKRPSSRLLN
tara:strand:- start:11 stop:346 length:336 start_codon:yes stop_codon:yes gene_type:complete